MEISEGAVKDDGATTGGSSARSGGLHAASGSMEQHEWEPLTGAKLIGFVAGVGLFPLLALRSEPGFVFLLDHANLLFHEAGHPVVGLLSSRPTWWGLLQYDTRIAALLRLAGWLGIAATCAWVAWRAWRERGRLQRGPS